MNTRLPKSSGCSRNATRTSPGNTRLSSCRYLPRSVLSPIIPVTRGRGKGERGSRGAEGRLRRCRGNPRGCPLRVHRGRAPTRCAPTGYPPDAAASTKDARPTGGGRTRRFSPTTEANTTACPRRGVRCYKLARTKSRNSRSADSGSALIWLSLTWSSYPSWKWLGNVRTACHRRWGALSCR